MVSLCVIAFLTGAATVPHCVAMCGPLAAHAGCGRGQGTRYHGARLTTLAVVGALAGWLGEGVALSLDPGVAQYVMSVVLAVGLGASAVRLWRDVERGERGTPWVRIRPKPTSASRAHALLVGAMTPLLPCAAVWSVTLLAVGTAAPLLGSAVMLAFGIPTALAVHASATTLLHLGRGRRGRRALSVALAMGALVTLLRPMDALRHGCVLP